MRVRVREARKEDASQMLNLYKDFAQELVGPAQRDLNTYRRMLRGKDRMGWIALGDKGKTIGYLTSRFDKRRREGRIEEMVVDPQHDFESVAKPLVDKAYNALMEKKPATIIVGSIREPRHEKTFPALGFFALETTTVFMYAVLNPQKFLNELAPIFAVRLKKMEGWSGLSQIECEGHSVFLQKTKKKIESVVWSNQPVSFKVSVSPDTLIKLLFGVLNPVEAGQSGQLRVETAQNQATTNQLLRAFFPKKQFLIMDYW